MKLHSFLAAVCLMVTINSRCEAAETTTEKPEVKMEPTFLELKEMTVAGIAVHAAPESGLFPELWESFPDTVEKSEGLVTGTYAYGVELFPPNFDKKKLFTYIAACEVADSRKVPLHLVTRTLPASRYAVFPVPGGLKGLGKTFQFIYKTWLPNSEYEVAYPFDMERYDIAHMKDGEMIVEILVPVKARKNN